MFKFDTGGKRETDRKKGKRVRTEVKEMPFSKHQSSIYFLRHSRASLFSYAISSWILFQSRRHVSVNYDSTTADIEHDRLSTSRLERILFVIPFTV